MRYSKQREAVFQALASTDTHPDVSWVYNMARKQIPNISLGTVYRNLNELCDCGRAMRISAEGHVERFDARAYSHPHFVCEKCGKVVDVDPSKVTIICNVDGVNKADVMLYGLCDQCKCDNGN